MTSSSSSKPFIVFVVGPTASGKSKFSIEAALRARSEIMNTDSVQIYKGVDIGTAKPTPEEMSRVPHHLFSVIPEGETCTAGEFRRLALACIVERSRAGAGPLFAVGGSGFYVQALEKGMYPVPDTPPEVRTAIELELRERGLAELFQELEARDPDYAASIEPQDTYRTKRALEILRVLQGAEIPVAPLRSPENTLSGIQKSFTAENERDRPFRAVKIGITRSRAAIRESVERRVEEMLQRGLIEEVRALRDQGLGQWLPMKSVGYRETQDFLDGSISRSELPGRIVTSTMQLAKRQSTWFRRDPNIQWFDAEAGWGAPLAWLDTQLARAKNEGL